MTDQTITGTIRLSDLDCPFSYQKLTEKITIYIGKRLFTVPEKNVIIGQKYGLISGGKILYKLNVPLSNDVNLAAEVHPKYVSFPILIRTVNYYIEDYQENSMYTEMRFQFPELNYFIPSSNRAKLLDKEFAFSREKEKVCFFCFLYHGTEVTISFYTQTIAHFSVKSIAETISEVALIFPATNDLDYLCGLYATVRCFFSFICNRRNIGLRSAELIGSYPTARKENGKNVCCTKQKIFFSQKYLEPEEDKKKVADTVNIHLLLEKLPELFKLFSEDTAESVAVVNYNSIHHSIKYRNLIDLEHSLHITATFEYYVRKLLPEMSSESTLMFIEILALVLDEMIKKVSGDIKKKAKSFKNTLSPQISLEEKIKKVYSGYSVWKPLYPILKEWFDEDISVLAKIANEWRNDLAHEKREYKPNIDVIKAIRLIEHINYCIVFRMAGYKDDRIKAILSEILIR